MSSETMYLMDTDGGLRLLAAPIGHGQVALTCPRGVILDARRVRLLADLLEGAINDYTRSDDDDQ